MSTNHTFDEFVDATDHFLGVLKPYYEIKDDATYENVLSLIDQLTGKGDVEKYGIIFKFLGERVNRYEDTTPVAGRF